MELPAPHPSYTTAPLKLDLRLFLEISNTEKSPYGPVACSTMSQQQAQNIITYVGVPLAVLGVLPTLSTTFQSLLTQRAIRRSLDDNGVQALTRSSLLSGIVEIEVPRLSIQPLDRNDPAYWKLRLQRSNLRGGSWTIFYWNEMVIGSKSYRLQYHDELIQPQAEIPFEALVAFLLDRGAVPCHQGLADLRGSGLWTPAGTKLLLSPITSDAALMIARSDDSDGILSLSLAWESEWDRPLSSRLPPYWVRICPGGKQPVKRDTKEAAQTPLLEELDDKCETEGTPAASEEEPHFPLPVRLRISANGVEQAYHEDSPKLALSLPRFHNANPQITMTPTCVWFNIACTALAAPSGGLWSFAIPATYISFSHRDSVPCGVLVLLGLLTDEEVPSWHTGNALTRIEQEEEDYEKHQRFLKHSEQVNKELRMNPEDARQARQDRMREEMWAIHEDARRERVKAERKAENEMRDAIASPRIGASVAGDAARKWLVQKQHVSDEIGATIAGVVQKTLYEMIESEGRASTITDMLEKWRAWTEGGGMTRANFEEITRKLEIFCCAACILALVKETSAHPTGSVVSDLQECLRMWKKVRLG